MAKYPVLGRVATGIVENDDRGTLKWRTERISRWSNGGNIGRSSTAVGRRLKFETAMLIAIVQHTVVASYNDGLKGRCRS